MRALIRTVVAFRAIRENARRWRGKLSILQGSFDCETASLCETVSSLRMTVYGHDGLVLIVRQLRHA
jgi:hypothetical protein